MGDLNFTPDSEHYTALCGFLTDSVSKAVGGVNTFPSVTPDRKIDYLFTNGLCTVSTASVPEQVVSDHRPYIAEITV